MIKLKQSWIDKAHIATAIMGIFTAVTMLVCGPVSVASFVMITLTFITEKITNKL